MAEGVDVAEGVDGAVVGPEDRDRLPVDQGGDTALERYGVDGAHGRHPGDCEVRHAGAPTGINAGAMGWTWSRSVVKAIVGSGVSGALTKVTNRASFSGSSSVARHSSAYPPTWRAISASSSAPRPSASSTTTSRTRSSPPSSCSIQVEVRWSRSAVRT